MDDQPRQILKQIIQQYGSDLIRDARRTRSLLLDLAGQHKREVNVLVVAAQDGIPSQLNSAGSQLMILLLPRLVRRLRDNWGLSQEAAQWAVESWALALGKLDEPDAGQMFSSPPRPPSMQSPAAARPQGNRWALPLTPDVPLDLVRVPAGVFAMGSPNNDPDAWDEEKPQHLIHLGSYWIGKHPVTVVQFAAFVDATSYRTTAEKLGTGGIWTGSGWDEVKGITWWRPQPRSDGRSQAIVTRKAEHPVTVVSWHDAVAFCRWMGSLTGQQVRLPTEAEWEKAARGASPTLGKGQRWPWGNALPDPDRCNFGEHIKDTTPVGKYSVIKPVSAGRNRRGSHGDPAPAGGDSPYGCTDMAGNVWEWTSTLFKDYPYREGDGREDPDTGDPRVVRGGSFGDDYRDVRCAVRLPSLPDSRHHRGGFRVCFK
ncbi:MAG: formylglycine-generating enzyme family protein, partial [Anaerolineales bacterium]